MKNITFSCIFLYEKIWFRNWKHYFKKIVHFHIIQCSQLLPLLLCLTFKAVWLCILNISLKPVSIKILLTSWKSPKVIQNKKLMRKLHMYFIYIVRICLSNFTKQWEALTSTNEKDEWMRYKNTVNQWEPVRWERTRDSARIKIKVIGLVLKYIIPETQFWITL